VNKINLKKISLDEFKNIYPNFKNSSILTEKNSSYFIINQIDKKVGGFRLVKIGKNYRLMNVFVFEKFSKKGYIPKSIIKLMELIENSNIFLRTYSENLKYWKNYSEFSKNITNNVFELKIDLEKIKKYIKMKENEKTDK